jgi:hypothetical protein
MKDCLDKANRYFVDKILQKDYKEIDRSEHTVHISVLDEDNEEHRFTLWTSNAPQSFGCYSGEFNSLHLRFTQEEKDHLWSRFKLEKAKMHMHYKEKRFYELKRELGK